MARMMPRLVHPSAFKSIAAETEQRHVAALAAGGQKWTEYSADLVAQQEFLGCFDKTFNVGHSLKVVGASMGAYNRWRASSITFVERFNEIVEMWHDEIYTSAAVRARGRKIENAETGDVTYIDGDTQLTKMFLRAMHEEFDERVDINMTGGMNNTTTPLDAEQYKELRKRMINEDDC